LPSLHRSSNLEDRHDDLPDEPGLRGSPHGSVERVDPPSILIFFFLTATGVFKTFPTLG
jgi:hypothetical protein